MTREIKTTQSGKVYEIAIQRPEKKNALTQAMYTALSEALDLAVATPEVRVILLYGDESYFTSGNDLSDFASFAAAPEKLASNDNPIVRFMHTLANCPKPVVAAVEGGAVGIGTTLLLHCDMVYCAESAQFALPFVNLGLCPEYGSALLLPQLAGFARASEWLLLGESFNAEAALQAGLVNEVLADPLARARSQCHKLAEKPPAALRKTKALLRQPHKAALEAVMQAEIEAFAKALAGPEFQEAVSAFFEKRSADFSQFS